MLSLGSELALREVLFGPDSKGNEKVGVSLASDSKGKEKKKIGVSLGSNAKGKEKVGVSQSCLEKDVGFSTSIKPGKDGWVSTRSEVKQELVCVLTLYGLSGHAQAFDDEDEKLKSIPSC